MQKTVLEKNVYYYEDSIKNFKKLVEIINEIDQENNYSEWTEWKISDFTCGYNKRYDIEKINALEDPVKSKMIFVYNTIQESFYEVCKDYGLSVGDNTEPIFHSFFDITKYDIGAGLGPHFDQGYEGNTLKYTMVMYLNDDYDGGEISFKLSHYTDINDLPLVDVFYENAVKENQIDFGLKPKAGSVIIFPASPPYRHTAHIVNSGSKYMVQLHWLYNSKEKGE